MRLLLHALSLVALFALCCWAPAAHAVTTCTATSTNVAFGTASTSGNTDVAATISVTCSTLALSALGNAKVRMCLNIGDGVSGGGNFNPRRMLDTTSDALQFQLYTDTARTQVWGSLGNAIVPNPGMMDFDYSVPLIVGGSRTQSITVYARVPTQTLIAGSYSNAFTGIHTSLAYSYNESIIGSASYPAACNSTGTSGTKTASGAFPFTVTATVPATCLASAYSATDLDFGSVPGDISANIDQASTIGLTCTGRTAWKLGLNNGANASGTTRRMRLGTTANYVAYELYRDAGRTQRWGGTIGTDTVDGTGTGSAQTVNVYGRVPAPQVPAAGSYGDTVTVTITY